MPRSGNPNGVSFEWIELPRMLLRRFSGLGSFDSMATPSRPLNAIVLPSPAAVPPIVVSVVGPLSR